MIDFLLEVDEPASEKLHSTSSADAKGETSAVKGE
jgi:hypothetical protein